MTTSGNSGLPMESIVTKIMLFYHHTTPAASFRPLVAGFNSPDDSIPVEAARKQAFDQRIIAAECWLGHRLLLPTHTVLKQIGDIHLVRRFRCNIDSRLRLQSRVRELLFQISNPLDEPMHDPSLGGVDRADRLSHLL